MPIIIKDIVWKDTDEVVTIKIPTMGTSFAKIDFFYSRGYIKTSYNQFFYEALLYDEIDVTRSNCTVSPTHIVFELKKIDKKLWKSLEKNVSRVERMKLKIQYMENEQERLQEESRNRIEKNAELKRVSIREQIVLDSRERETIQNVINYEKNKALEKLEFIPQTRKIIKYKTLNKPQTKKDETDGDLKSIPSLRSSDTVFVDFTIREFPTPSRESRLEEENEWLRKQSEARRSVGFIGEDLRPEECNPQFLKLKGDEFMKNRNYLGAISAYSFGVKLNDKFADLYVARGAAHFLQGNFAKCAQDYNRALELMKPEVPQNLKERALCIGRRGICLIRLGLNREGIGELEVSLNLIPNEEFENELEKIKLKLENADDSSD